MKDDINCEITIEVWGDFACFTPPYSKVERLTYPVPTPSAVRGILSAIYSKPPEFYWQVKKIEVLNPIRYTSFMRNEVKSTVSLKGDAESSVIYADEDRTQRQTQVLKNVRYRIMRRYVRAKTLPEQGNSCIHRRCGVYVPVKLSFSRRSE